MEIKNAPNISDIETKPSMIRQDEEIQSGPEQDPEICLSDSQTPVHPNRRNVSVREEGRPGNSPVPIIDFQAMRRNGRQLRQISERESENPATYLNRTGFKDGQRSYKTFNVAQNTADLSFRISLENFQINLLTKFNTVECAIKNLRQHVDYVQKLITDGMLRMKAGLGSGLQKKSQRSSRFTSK